MNHNNDKKQDRNNESDELKIYGPGGSTLQTPEEHQLDQSIDPREDNTMHVAKDDLRETEIDRLRNDLDGESGESETDRANQQ